MFETNELNANAQGGSEQMLTRIYNSVDPRLLSEFQIIPSRVRELKKDKIRILYCHDLPNDPESKHLANKGWEKFHKIVFVSYWQQQAYINYFGIPPSKTTVIKNAIVPFPPEKPALNTDKINFIYHTTPHRGLDILVTAFDQLAKKHPNIHLDVYSSFNAYGWPDADKPYEPLFDMIRNHPNMSYHGYVPNADIRKALVVADVFAYPCTWPETSCIALIEAMSAGCVCVHPTLAALPETAAGSTLMYDFQEDKTKHTETFIAMVDNLLDNTGAFRQSASFSRAYSSALYNWDSRREQWENLMKYLIETVMDRESMKEKEYLYVNTKG